MHICVRAWAHTHIHTHFMSLYLPCFHSSLNLDSTTNRVFLPPQYRICPRWKLLSISSEVHMSRYNYCNCTVFPFDSSVKGDMSVLRCSPHPLARLCFLLFRCWNCINLVPVRSLITHTHFVGSLEYLFTYLCFRCSPCF